MKQAQITDMIFTDDGKIPNNQELPVLLYSGAFAENPDECRETFKQNNWTNSWAGGVFDYHHYHSNAHEVLGIINGKIKLKIGGKKGTTFDLKTGDVVVLPAGTGHKEMSSSFEFEVVGAYPGGSNYNLKTGDPSERPEVLEEIKNVPLPDNDPVYGENGPLITMWVDKE
ncbi:uncharacterized protein YjlB [Salibacterium salarium]|uniref:cupin domain-containing protein n=1 Tax=Salibacterium salarium TaxID=284579 RepID=UPI00277E327E|nr:cupin domain-containing protein [Salibacterium salarium]MDQ0299318.1 uncharacterized protein YjlB [Salibacterium salarium]